MSDAVQIGPFALPSGVIATLAAIAAGWLAGGVLARRSGADAERLLTAMLVAGLVVSRAAFVLQWPRAYLDHPLAILDIRDGGFDWIAGIASSGLVHGSATVPCRPRCSSMRGGTSRAGAWASCRRRPSRSTSPAPVALDDAADAGSDGVRLTPVHMFT